jgi:hypothetical protein
MLPPKKKLSLGQSNNIFSYQSEAENVIQNKGRSIELIPCVFWD